MDLSALSSTLPPGLAEAEREMGDKFRGELSSQIHLCRSLRALVALDRRSCGTTWGMQCERIDKAARMAFQEKPSPGREAWIYGAKRTLGALGSGSEHLNNRYPDAMGGS